MAQDQVNIPRIVVIGGSSGALDVIMTILSGLTPHFPLPLLVVIHRGSNQDSLLQQVLGFRTRVVIAEVEEKEVMRPGHAYFAPSDYHVLIESDGSLSLDYSEKVHFSRPSIDVTFLSAAKSIGPGVIGVLLSGANEDGVAGMAQIKARGGYCIVQDPQDATVGYMPRQALKKLVPHAVLGGAAIAAALVALAAQAGLPR